MTGRTAVLLAALWITPADSQGVAERLYDEPDVTKALAIAMTCSTDAAYVFSATNADSAEAIARAALQHCYLDWQIASATLYVAQRRFGIGLPMADDVLP